MQFGAVLPTNEIGNDTGAVKAWAQAVESMGYDRIITYDHVLGAPHENREPPLTGPYTEHDPFREPMVLFGYLAGVTTRVELMPGVLVLPQRQTALVAKQAVEIDLLSDGRFVLGVGTGWNWVEYDSLNTEYRNRARRLDEQIDLLRQLWTTPVVDFTGQYHRVDRAGLLPLPNRTIPIWFGGYSAPAMERAARIGDGFYFTGASQRNHDSLAHFRDMLRANGRESDGFPVAGQVHTARGQEICASEAIAWKAASGTHLFVNTMAAKGVAGQLRCETVDDHIAKLQETLEMMRSL